MGTWGAHGGKDRGITAPCVGSLAAKGHLYHQAIFFFFFFKYLQNEAWRGKKTFSQFLGLVAASRS